MEEVHITKSKSHPPLPALPERNVLMRRTAQEEFSAVLPTTTLRGLEDNENHRIPDLLAIFNVVTFPVFFLFFF